MTPHILDIPRPILRSRRAIALMLSLTALAAVVFGAGAALPYLLSSSYLAIKRSLTDQHKEWMIRSYVVTFAFVTFRVIQPTLQAAHIGTPLEQLAAAAWACWAVPLLITELIIQGRKVLAIRAN